MHTCPECRRAKWKTVASTADFRRRALRCMECGFEVDAQVYRQARQILRRDNGEDLRPSPNVSES